MAANSAAPCTIYHPGVTQIRRTTSRSRVFSIVRFLQTAISLAAIASAGTAATAVGVAPVCAPRMHRMASGETLSAIARREGVLVSTLLAVQENPRVRQDPSLIRTGQLVRLPDSSALLSEWNQWPLPVVPTWRALQFELDGLLSADGGQCILELVRTPA